jgi:hypothetical protein
MQSLSFTEFQKMGDSFALAKGFSSRYGHPASGISIKILVFHDFQNNIGELHIVPATIQGLINAGTDTQQALVAEGPVNFSPFRKCHRDSPLGADFDTGAAPLAVDIPYYEIGEKILGFGIGTPDTTQGTTLHENSCPDARPIVDAETLDVENEALLLICNH